MISNGQARRIAAEWQAPRNAYSLLQHKGVIDDGLVDEIRTDMDSPHIDPVAYRELAALAAWVEEHGPGKVTPWGAWSDKPAR